MAIGIPSGEGPPAGYEDQGVPVGGLADEPNIIGQIVEWLGFSKARAFDFTAETLRFGAPVDVTIASNAITITSSNHNITASGTLNTINAWDSSGMMVLLTADAAVTIAHGSDNILCWGDQNISLDVGDLAILFRPDPTSTNYVAIGDTFSSTSHVRSHTITNTSDHTANMWKFIYTDGSGDVKEGALGADGTVWTGTGTSGAPAFEGADEHGHTSQGGITTVGALNAGSITSGFTSIDVGAGAITTTGAIAGITAANLVDKSATEAITGNWNFGAATVLEIPNAAAPTAPSVDGEIGIDLTVADWSHGILEYYGGELMRVVAMPTAQFTTPTDNHVVTYNATTDEFELQAGGGGGGQDLATDTLWAAQGDLVKGTGDDAADILTIGADHTVLCSDGSDPYYAAIPPLAGIADTGDIQRIALGTSAPHVKLTDLVQIGDTNDLTHGLGISAAPSANIGVNVGPVATLTANYAAYRAVCVLTSSANNQVIEGVVGNMTLYGTGDTGLKVYGLNFNAGGVGQATDTFAIINPLRVRGTAIAAGTATTVTALTGIDLALAAVQAVGTLSVTKATSILVADPNSAQIVDYTGLQIDNEAAASGNIYGIYTDMVGTHAIFVDAGSCRFDGDGTNVFYLPTDNTDPTSGGGAATGRIPVDIGGATKYIPYY